jgi:ankyrin repeat protein
MVELLLDAGASANSPPSEEYTSPLHAAIASRNFSFAQRLINSGADVNAHDLRFGTPLTAASFWGAVELMKKLVDLGADPNLSGHRNG